MLKPEEVTSVVFEKAVFGGYEIAAVDKFLNQLTKDYSALCRDNELLKNRLAAIAGKIEEYRANEDAMRLALLSAKKAARESEERAKAAHAAEKAAEPAPSISEPEAKDRLNTLAAELKTEEAALRRARKATETYLSRFREATAACEAALTDLYTEADPESIGAAASASDDREAAKAAEPEMTDLSFIDLDFGRN